MDGFISNIQPFSLQDGPGIRTTVFMKGCNLRCYWCHNPEAMSFNAVLQFFEKKCIGCGACIQACPFGDLKNWTSARFTDRCLQCGKCAEACFSNALVLTGRYISAEELINLLERDRDIFIRTGGGVTFSGGEPLLQHEFVAEVMKECKSRGISTAIETALNVRKEIVEKVLPYVDTFICDLKACDPQKHRQGTGVDNSLILQNIRIVAQQHRRVLVRTPIVPGFNDTEEDMQEHVRFLQTLSSPVEVELLPFHGICENKYQSMNLFYGASGKKTPDKEKMKILTEVYRKGGVSVKP